MDKIFVRRSFYLNPPRKNASFKEWKQWAAADEREARKAQYRFNRAYKITQSIEATSEEPLKLIDGVYRQVPYIRSKRLK
jgi:hypothetical protein